MYIVRPLTISEPLEITSSWQGRPMLLDQEEIGFVAEHEGKLLGYFDIAATKGQSVLLLEDVRVGRQINVEACFEDTFPDHLIVIPPIDDDARRRDLYLRPLFSPMEGAAWLLTTKSRIK